MNADLSPTLIPAAEARALGERGDLFAVASVTP
jgi:hypothetical protein